MANRITSKIEEGKIVIEIPVELLKQAQENRENPYKILNLAEMTNYVAENITEFGEDSETGLTAFQELIDRLFNDAYENAEEWIEEHWNDDEEVD